MPASDHISRATSPGGLSSLLAKAVGYHRSGRVERARTSYQQVLEDYPDQPDAMHLLGVLECECGNHRLAIALIGKAIESAPAQPAFYSNLGNAFRGVGSIEKAIACYQKSIAVDSNFRSAHYNLAFAYRQVGRLSDAETIIRKALGKKATGLITPHSFRHFFVTTILRGSGGNIKLAQELARHKNISVTQRYAHLSDGELDQGYWDIFEKK